MDILVLVFVIVVVLPFMISFFAFIWTMVGAAKLIRMPSEWYESTNFYKNRKAKAISNYRKGLGY